jgi:O-antigen ligase
VVVELQRNWRDWVSRVGCNAALVFAVFAFLGAGGANVAWGVMVIALVVLLPKQWPVLRKDPVFWWAVAFFGYILARAALASWQFPEYSAAQWSETGIWMKSFFPVVALWVARGGGRWALILALAALGLWIDLSYEAITRWDEFVRSLQGDYFAFGKTRSAAGLIIMTAVLGSIVFARRFLGTPALHARFILRLVIWAAFFITAAEAVIAIQARGTWLSAAVVLPIVVVAMLWRRREPNRDWTRTAILLVGVTAFVALVAMNADLVKNRISQERDSFATFFAGAPEKLPYDSSVGLRGHLLQLGMEKWRERPIFGWGPADTKWLIRQHPVPNVAMLPHFHNTYVELLVRFGIVGTVLFFALIATLLWRFWRRYRQGAVPRDLFVFAMGAFGLFAVWSLSGFRMVNADGLFYWLLLLGLVHALTLQELPGSTTGDGRSARNDR